MAYQLDMERIPQHIAVIMDGNGRWAAERGHERSYGHQAGVDAVRRITSECTRLGVRYLTLYTFSTENWNRPTDEIAALMGLVLSSLEDEIFMKNNVRFRVVGDMGRLPENVRRKLRETEEHTAGNTAMTMVVALCYSSRWEITEAVKAIATEVKDGRIGIGDGAMFFCSTREITTPVFRVTAVRWIIGASTSPRRLCWIWRRKLPADGCCLDFPKT